MEALFLILHFVSRLRLSAPLPARAFFHPRESCAVLLCQLLNAIQPGIIPTVNTAHGPFPEMENISAFIAACRTVGVAEHSLFDTQDLHEKRNMEAVLRCMSALGATVKSTLPSFQGPYLGASLSTAGAVGTGRGTGDGGGGGNMVHKDDLCPQFFNREIVAFVREMMLALMCG